MKNTYYTPELEEFYLGFECEYYNRETEIWEKLTIDTIKLQLNEFNYYLFYDKEGEERDNYNFLSESPKFRVKYLDFQDIEELGFEHIKTQPGSEEGMFKSKNSEHFMAYDYESNYCRIYFSLYDGDATIFAGTIRNKSELKTLLKQQLKINNEDS